MNDDKINKVFETLDFDVFEPSGNHENEFLNKLKNASNPNNKNTSSATSKVINLWKPFILVAACMAIGVFIFNANPMSQDNEADLASVSEEMADTQDFYSSVITSELENLQNQETPETKTLVEDTMKQLEVLEAEYQQLKKDLITSGQDQRVIYAMINNFQQRIALLQTVLQTIDDLKQLKLQNNESNIL